MTSSETKSDASYFGKFTDRLSYTGQVIIARKFNRNLSLTLLPTLVHRNRVGYTWIKMIFLRWAVVEGLKVLQAHGLVGGIFLSVPEVSRARIILKQQAGNLYNPLAVGLEIETGGHVFHVNFTNSTAILENQFIPETTTSWLQGQFRWGFNISRRFSL